MRFRIGGEQQRYLIVGAICAVLNNVILIGGDWLGLNYVMLTGLTFVITATPVYWLHCWFTFRHGGNLAGYLIFMSGCAIATPVALLLLAILHSLLGLPMWIAAPVTTVLMIIYNYCNARMAILRRMLGRMPIAAIRKA